MKIREATPQDRADWFRMREALWPDSFADHDLDTQRFFDRPDERMRTFVAEDGGKLVGFLEGALLVISHSPDFDPTTGQVSYTPGPPSPRRHQALIEWPTRRGSITWTFETRTVP